MTFDPAETEKEVEIPITDDSVLEGLEDFTAVLRAMDPSVVEIVNGSASVTIVDNDGTLIFRCTLYTA